MSTGAAPQASRPPTYDEASTINVLVTGECQQGKSTLIRQLAQYADIPNLPIAIGSGSIRCTTEVGNYDMPVTLREYQLVDPNNEPIGNREYTDLVELNHEEARIVELRGSKMPGYRFRFIDTPGLDDTFGEDFSIMSRTLSRAADLGHINALIYVRSVDNGFGSSFQQFFRYIQKSMPSLCNGLIVVHSRFTVDRVEEFLNENQRLDEIRRQAFEAATHLELQHFFMDNCPDSSYPFAVLQSLNEIYRLLLHVSSQRPLPVNNMKLLKTDAMRHMDVHVANTLRTLAHGLDKQWSLEKDKAEVFKANAMSAQGEISKLKSKIKTKEDRMRELDSTDEILLGTKSCVVPYSFVGHLLLAGALNLGTRALEYDSDYVISSVEKSCSSGSEWLDEDLRGTSWRGKITSTLFRDINGTATFYTTMQQKHKPEIEALQAAILDLQDMLAVQEQNQTRNTGVVGPDSRLAQLSDNIAKVEELMDVVQRDSLDITLWPQLRGFYTMKSFPTAENIRDFVQVYYANVGRLL